MKKPLFSIIICTHNRGEILNQSLKKYRKIVDVSDIEIIIVPNGCNDSTIAVIHNHQRFLDNLRYIEIEKAGHSNARNIGFKTALSEFVFYIDDDAYPDKNIVNVIRPVLEMGYPIITGSIRYWKFETDKNWIKNSYIEYVLPYDKITLLSENEYIHGCACGFQKNMLAKINFNTKYGMKAEKVGYYDEIFVQREAKKKDIDSYYIPDLTIFHRSHFNTIFGFLKSHFNKGIYYSQYHSDINNIKKFLGSFFFLINDFLVCSHNIRYLNFHQFIIEWFDRPLNYLGQATSKFFK